MRAKKSIFFIGLPGAGKTTLIEKRKYTNVVSADDIKSGLENFDINHPELVHQESVKLAEELIYENIKEGKDFTFDCGGVNNSYSLRILNITKEARYYIKLIYVKTPLEVCLERNKSRDRKIPSDEIVKKSSKIETCFEQQKQIVDEIEIIDYEKM